VGLMPTYQTLMVMLVPTGAAALTFTIAANSSVQLGADPALRGRVMALYLMCFMGGTPLGAPVIGALSDAFGPRAGVYGGGAVCAVAAAVLGGLFARRRGLRLREQVVHALPHPRVPRRPARAYQRGRRSRHAAGSSSRSTSSVSESSR
ncbi:MAG TPA: MFS transporter, partial [Mycobacteriales bacterium]|nr:MFS transporter [Mycobacteriales bacterium]